MALAEGLVGGLLVDEVDLKTSPKGTFKLVDESGSFDLGDFDVFDIIDLPVSYCTLSHIRRSPDPPMT
jgi:hypothetical protein